MRSNLKEKQRILIVSEERDLIDNLTGILEKQNYKVSIAVNEKEAMGLVRDYKIEVALIDVQLNYYSVIDLILTLKKVSFGLNCIMITEYDSSDVAIEAIRSGAFDYLRKPVNKHELLFVLEKCFDGIGECHQNKEEKDFLNESEKQIQYLFENFPGYIIIINREGIIQYINRLLINSLEDVVGKSIYDFNASESSDYYKEILSNIDRTGKTYTTESTGPSIDGGIAWYEISCIPLKKEGAIVNYLLFIVNITERKRAEGALKKSKAMLDSIFQVSPSGIILISNREVKEVNERICQMTGYTGEDLYGKSTRMLYFDEKEYKRVGRNLYKMICKSGSGSIETLWRHKNGGVIDVFLSTTLISPDEDFQVLAFTALDITERKRVERELKQNEEHYRLLADNVSDVIWTSDLGINITYSSPSVEKLRGFTVDEVMNQNLDQILTPKSFEYAFSLLSEKMESIQDGTYQPMTIELEFKHKDGSFIITESTISVVYDNNNMPIRLLGVTRDIRERRRTEEALRESEERLRSVLQNSPDYIITVDRDCKIIYLNRSFPGYSINNMIGTYIFDYTLKEYYEIYKKTIEKVFLTKKMATIESIVPLQHDQNAVFDSRFGPTMLDGRVVSVVMIATDISDRKKAEEDKERIQVQLRQSQKMEAIGTLAGGIAHDFNNILSGIFGYTELAMRKQSKKSEVYNYLSQIFHAANRASDLVSQILTLSRQQDQDRKPVDVGLIVEETLKFLRASLPSTIVISINISSKSDMVLADATQIQQIIMNLCTNAMHAMQLNGGILSVKLNKIDLDSQFVNKFSDLRAGKYLMLEVSDTGHGMSSKIIDRIFDPFFTTKQKGAGTGLGLAIIHGIVKSYEGAITVHSEVDKGSTFQLFLPIVDSIHSEKETEEEKFLPGGNECILVVDDEVSLVDMIKEMLEELGYQVTSMISSVDALEAFELQPDKFDVVITDHTMPNMTGAEMAQKMLSRRPNTPIIMCTGFSDQVNYEKAKLMGISEFLSKPISYQDYAEAIMRVLLKRKGLLQ